MSQIFPYSNIVTGILVFIVGFVFHWAGQLISVIHWDFATKLGLQEKGLPEAYKVYEQALAVADCLLGWLYGAAAIGLFLDAAWGYKLAWFPGIVLLYHGLSYWFWTRNQARDGNVLQSAKMRTGWFLANLITGLLTVIVAWNAT